MSNVVSISFKKHQVAQTVSAMVAGTSHQITQASQFDEQAGTDTAPGVGEVKYEDNDQFVEVGYDPQTKIANNFHFKAKNNVAAPNGQILVPQGMETTMNRSADGVESYRQSIPTPDGGTATHTAILDPNSQTINYNNETTLSFQENLASGAAANVVGVVNQQIGLYAQLDNRPGVDTAPEPGKMRAQDPTSSVEVDYNPQTGVASHFSFETLQAVPAQGLPKGLKRSMSRDENGVETYSQTGPTQDGKFLTQQVKVDPSTENITYNEWVLNY